MPERILGEGIAFVGGAPRSGLTVLRRHLVAHPDIVCGPDTGMAPAIAAQAANFRANLASLHKKDFALDEDEVQQLFGRLIARLLSADRSAERVLIEKTSLNVVVFERLAAMLPRAKFIHVVRDGRDVVSSLLARDWRDPATGAKYPHVASAEAAARYWAGLVELGFRAEMALAPTGRIIRIRYEDLIARPAATLANAFNFLDLDPARIGTPPEDMPLGALEKESLPQLFAPLTDAYSGVAPRRLPATALDAIDSIIAPMSALLSRR